MKLFGKTIFYFILFIVIISCKQEPSKSNLKEYRLYFKTHLPKPNGYVNDFEHLFSKSQKDSLIKLIENFEKATTTQIAIITIDSFSVEKDSFNSLVLNIANTWGVGTKEKNNGITIGISSLYKKIRICNGIGVEKILTDQETKIIRDSYFIPSLKLSNYFEGVYLGTKEIIRVLNQKGI